MARRVTESLSVSSSAGGSVVDDETEDEAWLCRSTVCVSDAGEHRDNDAEACSWSQLNTPIPFTGGLYCAQTNGGGYLETEAAKGSAGLASGSPARKRKCMLPRIPGFSNADALQTQFPRLATKRPYARRMQDAGKADRQYKAQLSSEGTAEASHDLTLSRDEVEANRRKWDIERELQDGAHGYDSREQVGDAGRKRSLKRKLQFLNPVIPSAAEQEANRRKWDLERKLQEENRGMNSINAVAGGANWKRDFRVKLQRLNPFAMNPTVPSAAEIEFNRRKWDLERRLQDEAQVGKPRDNMDIDRGVGRKLASLNPLATNPVTLSAIEVEANRRKWELERNLQDADQSVSIQAASRSEPKRGFNEKLRALCPAASLVEKAKPGKQKWCLERMLCNMEDQPEHNLQAFEEVSVQRKLSLDATPSPCAGDRSQGQSEFKMTSSLVYLLLFFSTAVLHCAIFNFNLELRRFLHLDSYPFGVLLLLSWIFIGLVHFVGGVVGDVVRDRVILLQRIAVLWCVAVVALHVAAFRLSSLISSISLVVGLMCTGVAHGIVCPNVVALNVESLYCKTPSVFTPMSPENEEESGSDDDSAAESDSSFSSDGSSLLSADEQPTCDSTSRNFFSGCFAARLAGSSLVQAYYFLLVDISFDDGFQSHLTSRGFHFMLLMAFGLLASFIYFCYTSWGYCVVNERYPGPLSLFAGVSESQKFENKLEALEQGFNASLRVIWSWSWRNVVQLCNRALVCYALLAFLLMMLIGTGFSVVIFIASHTSLSVRLVAFLLIVVGWLLSMIASSRQLNPSKKQLLRECRRLGLRSRQLYLALLAIAFICVSGCVSFLRAQLYTTMVVQVCQTRLLIPGTTHSLFNPELLGAAVGASSLLFLGLTRALIGGANSRETDSVRSPTKSINFTSAVPATPAFVKIERLPLSRRLLSWLPSCPSVTRMRFAMLLYLVSIFLSSVVELYRRKAVVSQSALPRSCGSEHSDFTFLWTSPYVALLGASDALFRISLQEQCHELAQDSFLSSSARKRPRRWAGAVQGVISLAEALGYTAALALVAMLSRWLFRPKLTDMALLFLLLTTVVALTHALLNRIAARAQAYQHQSI
ncbi:unnamed protein product [Phytophthora fragariaefolia]|uniref:Unnamed protein product n=1 Tax=Phytophthora fragariaefolia TaxID=1490495 RepID=A0A9W6XBK9_9STRA|nr:unnamed protein product [Phytophthora fragariaefolia]